MVEYQAFKGAFFRALIRKNPLSNAIPEFPQAEFRDSLPVAGNLLEQVRMVGQGSTKYWDS